ncbi:nucleocytoplasmic transporter NUP145 KNAG_0F02170 [Huiozyma naganishii CBS 8797]|uniref:Peptidase S59 domain-containing protein n=1 Tax=Huiozyma naganishii (strain ATCC MYA-139 / BCRC 22969 / CBS 8797 / KCTC 17520 / NBRC 10181 / NCYC 3082 / Yp74L-3) TaxID=1071383 RepID=J7S7B7_HUIN7|nr:hypothetical protein KNAG_0F02170 [Kazachstania naganishii CBS 8797]CCK70884.1 hypothetical protein KNAG_0F02170 [Kazachstania naganishii CBS 8797]
MFNRNSNGSSLFGNVNTSTPTSTPGPNTAAGSNAQFMQKPTVSGGMFGAPNGNLSGTMANSTPSPSTTLFNRNPPANQTGTGLFGNSSQQQQTNQSGTGLFGNGNQQQQTNQSGTGLFGNSNQQQQTNNQTNGLFGNNSTNFSTTGGLFGNKTGGPTTLQTNTPKSTGPSLFGNSNTNNQGTGLSGGPKPATGGLFGNSANTGALGGSGGLFGGNPTNAVNRPFGTNSSNVGNPLLGNSAAVKAETNPYGINVNSGPTNNVPFSSASIPASITSSLNGEVSQKRQNRSDFDNTANTGYRRSSWMSSSNSIPKPTVNMPHSNLFNKLSSRLNSSDKHSATRGIFSQSYGKSWSGNDYSRDSDLLSARKDFSMNKSGLLTSDREGITQLRRLKIDPNRSAAKKIKLFSGNAVVTQDHHDSFDLDEKNEDREVTNNTNNNSDNDNNDVPHKNQGPSEHLPKESNSPDIGADINVVGQKSSELSTDYWCSPSVAILKDLTVSQLCAVPNFVIGRKGYGSITFNTDVNLTDFAPNFADELFGKTVIFRQTKTVEVYPDSNRKPPIGYGLNVSATITLENVYPVDKKTKTPITDPSKTNEVHLLIKRLGNMSDMEFISYNPFGGVWTFKVKHFSIWGLVNEEDVEVSDEAVVEMLKKEQNSKLGTDRTQRNLAQSNQTVTNENHFSGKQSFDPSMLEKRDVPDNSQLMIHPEFDDDYMIDEKEYEPDVTEHDFEGLQADPMLATSRDWVEQLTLAGSSSKTIFGKMMSNPKAIGYGQVSDMLLEYNKELETDKKITSELRLSTSSKFAKVLDNNFVLLKDIRTNSGTAVCELLGLSSKQSVLQTSINPDQLKLSEITLRSDNGYPSIAKFSLEFKNLLEHAGKNNKMYKIWQLCSILFDPISFPFEVSNSSSAKPLLKRYRYEKLCQWLVEQIKPTFDTSNNHNAFPAQMIFTHLIMNDVISASRTALESQNGHLSILLTYLDSNNPRVRELAGEQLAVWEASGHFIDSDIIRIYQLLSGTLFEDKVEIEKLSEEYGWLSVVALHIFYGTIDELSLEELVKQSISSLVVEEKNLIYCVLDLYGEEHDIEQLLISYMVDNHISDIQFVWYMVQLLNFGSSRTFSNAFCDKITLQFIDQLKISQLELEALYVSYFLNDDLCARHHIDSIVYRKLPAIWTIDEREYLDLFKLPEHLVFKALALKEKYDGNFIAAVGYMLQANCFSQARRDIISRVGPYFILTFQQTGDRTNLEKLNDVLTRFSNEERENWEYDLSVFEQFVQFALAEKPDLKKVHSIKNGVKLLYQNNKHCRYIPACCDVILKTIKNIERQ